MSYDLAWSGFRDDALFLLDICSREQGFDHPILWYTLSWLADSLGLKDQCREYASRAEATNSLYCFPARLEEMIVLETIIRLGLSGAKAHYYLGNLYYDRRRYEEAIQCWRRSVELDAGFSIPWRNLGIAEFNVHRNAEAASQMYERAMSVNNEDARVLYEWDQLKKRVGSASPEERQLSLDKHPALVEHRDDLAVEYITLLNQCGKWQSALQRMNARRFSPWEGGEGLVSTQFVYAHRALGLEALAAGDARRSLEHFEAARQYPENLGEGKHLLTLERDLDYFSGLAAQAIGNPDAAQRFWKAAAAALQAIGVHSYFQGMALREIGQREAAHAVFSSLADFAAKQMAIEPQIDYFATSLPNLLLFDDDLAKRNRVESLLLSALAADGLGDSKVAIGGLKRLLTEDRNHLFAAQMLRWLSREKIHPGDAVEVHLKQ